MSLEKILVECGFPYTYKGFPALLSVICTGCGSENNRIVFGKLYLEIAPSIHSNPQCMERNMRTIIKYVWYRCDREPLRKISGCSALNRKPTVTEVIEIFICYVNDHFDQIILK